MKCRKPVVDDRSRVKNRGSVNEHAIFNEIRFDEESKRTSHGLLRYSSKVKEIERSQRLNDLLDAEKINQVVILAKSVQRASAPKKIVGQGELSFRCHSFCLNQEDCFGYCDMEGVFGTNDNPRCRTAGVLN